MTYREILLALQAEPVLLTMLTEEIGETALREPDDDEGGRTWSELGEAAIAVLLSYPLDD